MENKAVNFETMRDLIIALNLSETVLELFDGNCKVDALQDDFKDPYAILCLSAEEQKHYLADRYKPILSFAFGEVIAYDIVSQKYVRYYIELFEEEFLEPMSWDGTFVDTVIYWYESEYYSDDEIINFCNLLGIKQIKTILGKIKQHEEEDTSLEWDEWLKAIKQEIDNMR
jgi:hypothetical protein